MADVVTFVRATLKLSYRSQPVGLGNHRVEFPPCASPLQTMEYTREFMVVDGIDPSNIEFRLMARLRRQQVLRGAVEYLVLIGEAALRPALGGEALMAAQLRHITVTAKTSNVTVRIVPSAAVHSRMLGPFLLLEFPVATPIAHIELLRSAIFLEREDATPYVTAAARVKAVALDATESLRLIAERTKELDPGG